MMKYNEMCLVLALCSTHSLIRQDYNSDYQHYYTLNVINDGTQARLTAIHCQATLNVSSETKEFLTGLLNCIFIIPDKYPGGFSYRIMLSLFL